MEGRYRVYFYSVYSRGGKKGETGNSVKPRHKPLPSLRPPPVGRVIQVETAIRRESTWKSETDWDRERGGEDRKYRSDIHMYVGLGYNVFKLREKGLAWLWYICIYLWYIYRWWVKNATDWLTKRDGPLNEEGKLNGMLGPFSHPFPRRTLYRVQALTRRICAAAICPGLRERERGRFCLRCVLSSSEEDSI